MLRRYNLGGLKRVPFPYSAPADASTNSQTDGQISMMTGVRPFNALRALAYPKYSPGA